MIIWWPFPLLLLRHSAVRWLWGAACVCLPGLQMDLRSSNQLNSSVSFKFHIYICSLHKIHVFPTMIFRYVLGNIGRLELRAGRIICISWGEMSRFTKNKWQIKYKHKYTWKYTQINPYLIFFNFGIPLHYLGLQKYTKSCVNSQQNSQNLPK